jgi:heat shock protein HtpX
MPQEIDPRHYRSTTGFSRSGLKDGEGARHGRRSRRHAALMLAAMAILLGYCGWIVAGMEGVLLGAFLGGMTLLVIRQMPPEVVLRALGARFIPSQQAPALYDILDRLCRRAGLARVPALYVADTRFPTAFTIGAGESAAIALSQGLLAVMTTREIRGVLAHEIMHIRNGDIALMQLALVAGQLARLLAQLALLLLLFGLLLHAAAVPSYPLVPLLLLVAAPLAIGLLRRALSREREGEADLGAAELTGDPAGLAMALADMRRLEQKLIAARFPGMRLIRIPGLLRDHPATEERIRRLWTMPQMPDAESSGDRTPATSVKDPAAWPWE